MTVAKYSPPQFRKKPVVVEAMLFDGTIPCANAIGTWKHGVVITTTDAGKLAIAINTLEGEMMAMPGDYIIKGVQGEFYPCKPDIFESTYERA